MLLYRVVGDHSEQVVPVATKPVENPDELGCTWSSNLNQIIAEHEAANNVGIESSNCYHTKATNIMEKATASSELQEQLVGEEKTKIVDITEVVPVVDIQ